MDFQRRLIEVREKGWSDIEIAEEITKMSGFPVSRQRIYNYRTGKRNNPAIFEISMAILTLHERLCE